MPSTYSSNLKLELMATGENSGTWGNITNTNLGTAVEQAIIGYGTVDYVADANLTISITNSNSAQAARALVLNVTSGFGSLTQTRELVVPTIEKQYIVQNNTTGGQSITVKTSGGTGITVPNGRKAHLYVDGTNVIQMFDFVDINGGTIDGATVGASSASTGAFTTLAASGAATFNGAVTLGDAAADNITFNGTITSHLLFTDNTYDIGASGATRPRNLYLAGAATIGGNLSVGGTLTLTGGVNLNGNVTVGDSSADTLTINSTITSNLIFTDNTYDIGASGATRPRNLFLAGNITAGGNQTLTGSLTVDSTTDSSSTTTGSIQTDGGLGVAKALYVGTTANIAGNVTLSGGTANGVAYLNGSKVLTTGSALTFDGTTLYGTNAKFGNGVASNTSKLMVNTVSGTAAGIQLYQDGNESWIMENVASSTALRWMASGSEKMRIDSSGNVGIGTSSGSTFGVFTVNTSSSANTPIVAITANFLSPYLNHYITDSGSTVRNLNQIGFHTGSSDSSNYQGFMTFSTMASAGGTISERMRITSSGNVGIGIANPPYKLVVSDAGNGGFEFDPTLGAPLFQCYDRTTSAYKDMTTSALSLRFNTGTSPAERMRIDSSGNVGIGTSSPSGKFHAVATTTNQVGVSGSGLGTGYGVVGYGGNTAGGHGVYGQAGTGAGSHGVVGQGGGVGGYGVLGTGSTSGGYGVLGVAGTSSYGGVYGQAANGTIYGILGHVNVYAFYGVGKLYNSDEVYIAGTTDQGAYNLQCNGTGVWGAGAYVNGSDERIKQDIEPINSALPIINALEPVTFRYKSEYSKDQNIQPGFIAQQLKAVMANETYVDGVVQKGPEYFNLAYQSLVPLLTKAIQEQQAIIESLKSRLDAANL